MSAPILICFDGSQGAEAAIPAAASLLREREALVLSVAIPAKDEVHFNPAGALVGRLSKLYREWDEYVRELAEQQARAGCELAAGAGMQARPLTGFGKPAEEIVRVADEHAAAAIVLGARRHTVVGGVLGSVSARVVTQSGCPVLVIGGR